MPRRDRTFTAADVIRIWCDNLDSGEKAEVAIFFLAIYAPRGANELLDFISDTLEPFGVRTALLRRTLRVMTQVFDLAAGLNIFIFQRFFSVKTWAAIFDCMLDS